MLRRLDRLIADEAQVCWNSERLEITDPDGRRTVIRRVDFDPFRTPFNLQAERAPQLAVSHNQRLPSPAFAATRNAPWHEFARGGDRITHRSG